jgi:hypothetical protein
LTKYVGQPSAASALESALVRSVPEQWITKCCSKLIYEILLGKEVVYILPITSILWRLPAIGLEILEPYCSAISTALAKLQQVQS